MKSIKKQRFLKKSCFELVSPPGFDLGPSRAQFWEPFGPQDASKTAPRAPKIRPRAPKRLPSPLQDRPRGVPDCPKRPPRLLQEAFRRPRSSKRRLESHLGPILNPFWTNFDAKTIPPQACGQLFARHPAAALARMRHLDNSQHRFPQSSSEDGFHNSRNDPSEL